MPLLIELDYIPGDKIVKYWPSGRVSVYVVDDPVRTTYGKLRLRSESGAIRTTWWKLGGFLPKHYVAELIERN